MASLEENKTEIYFTWWLDDLIEAGYVEKYTFQPYTIQLFPEVDIKYKKVKQLKTKKKISQCNHKLLESASYTPDYEIIFTYKARGLFFSNINKDCYNSFNELFYFFNLDDKSNKCLVDVKSADYQLGMNTSTVKFPIIQKFLYHYKNIMINRIIPFKGKSCHKNYLFPNTFTPKRFLLTDKKRGKRTIHFPVRGLEEFTSIYLDEKHIYC